MCKTKIIGVIILVAAFAAVFSWSFLVWQKGHLVGVLAQYGGYAYDVEFNETCASYITSPSYPLYAYSDIPTSYTGTSVQLEISPSCEILSLCDADYASCATASCDSEGKCLASVTPGERLYFKIANNASDPYCRASHTCLQVMAAAASAPAAPSTPPSSSSSPSSPSSGEQSSCGDGVCKESQYFFVASEDCENCPADCGQCIGASCGSSYDCESNFCYEGVCQAPPQCGDNSCAGGETCASCATDCGQCQKGNGGACSSDGDCTSGYCVHNVCRPQSFYCGDRACDAGEDCEICQGDCGACDSASCRQSTDCAGSYCVHNKCRSQATYCGDSECDPGESCTSCAADCCGSDLKISFSATRLQLKPGDTDSLQVNLKNSGKSAAQNVSWTILVDKDSLINVAPKDKKIGNIAAAAESTQTIKITANSPGEAYLAIHFRGDNFGSILKFIRVSVETGMALDVPDAIFLLPQEEHQFGVFVINQGNEVAQVKSLTMESLDPAVVEVKEGSTMEVGGQGDGLAPDQLFSTESEDILKAIMPRPKIQAKDIGETELVFKLNYYLPQSKRTESLEKKTKVKVSFEQGGKESILDVQIIPAGIVLEIGEAREVKIILKNQGSSVIREGKVILNKPAQAYFEATQEVRFGAIEPGQKADAKIDLVATDETPSFFTQNNAAQEKAITDSLVLDGHYQTVSGKEFNFQKEIKVALVKERLACKPEDPACGKAVDCLVELSNSMSCTLEVADIIPYLDKPVATVLATSDICEIKNRADAGDTIGAAISAALFTVDLGDNVADVVPVAGNLASAFSDTVEGAADCAEGFIYDGVNQYCTGGEGGGYTACTQKIFELFAAETKKFQNPQALQRYVVATIGSPVSFRLVDNQGKDLKVSQGVAVFQIGDLKMAVLRDPQNLKGGFSFEILGQENGNYNLHLALIQDGEIIETRELTQKPIQQDKTAEIPVLVQADSQGALAKLLVGRGEFSFFQKMASLKKLGRSLYLAKILLIFFVVFFISLVVLMLWRQKKRAGEN